MPRLYSKNSIYPVYSLLAALLVFSVGVFLVNEPWFKYFILAIALLILVFGLAFEFLKMQVLWIPVCLLVVALALVSAPLEKAIENGLRMYLFGLAAFFSLTVNPLEFVRILNRKEKTAVFTLGILISLRFFHIMKTEIARIRMAIKLSGIRHILFRPSYLFRAFIIPLFIRIFSISDTLCMSLETRGFDKHKGLKPYKLRKPVLRDHIFLVLLFIVIAGGIYGKLS